MAEVPKVDRPKAQIIVGALSIIGAVLGSIITVDIANYIFTISVAVLVVVAIWAGVDFLRARMVRARRGIIAAGGERMRAPEFVRVWHTARKTILCTGVGMTGIVKEEPVIRAAVERGVRVEFIMVDPEWLKGRPDIAKMVDDFYDRNNFVDTIAESLSRLENLSDRLNADFGAGVVKIRTIKKFFHQSGTIADHETENAHGFIEFHLYQSPIGRFRIKVRGYRGSDDQLEDPSLVQHWISAHLRALANDTPGPLLPGLPSGERQ